MRRFFNTIAHLLLLLIMVQALGLNAAACAAKYETHPAATQHSLVNTAAHYLEAGSIHLQHKGRSAGKTHCHHKAHKKYFPGKIVVSTKQQLRPAAGPEEALVHYAMVTGYYFLYFKSINPPPPKA
ncbi:hypothetical protein [Taibaiella helva]|uniref:hypothetical protein n=1 Tax=Taibaiella helva TaxID=2301235 RepID=UPI000E56F995|nr:hypothetical protein [Taibaiella helva]